MPDISEYRRGYELGAKYRADKDAFVGVNIAAQELFLNVLESTEYDMGYRDGYNGREFSPPPPKAETPTPSFFESAATGSSGGGGSTSGSSWGGESTDDILIPMLGFVFLVMLAIAVPVAIIMAVVGAVGVAPAVLLVIASGYFYFTRWKHLWSGTRKAVITLYIGVLFPLAITLDQIHEGLSRPDSVFGFIPLAGTSPLTRSDPVALG